LWVPVIASVAAILLLSTHDGGAQWGPRFLLIAAPALIVLVCQAAHRVIERKGEWYAARVTLAILLIAGAVYANRDAYRELRGTKLFYARIVDETVSAVPASGYVISRVWWFDQITATHYGRQTVLYVDDDAEERAALAQLEAARIASVTLVLSDESGERRSAPLTTDTCFRVSAERRIEERTLRFLTLSCRP
jgi:hypothetical protein